MKLQNQGTPNILISFDIQGMLTPSWSSSHGSHDIELDHAWPSKWTKNGIPMINHRQFGVWFMKLGMPLLGMISAMPPFCPEGLFITLSGIRHWIHERGRHVRNKKNWGRLPALIFQIWDTHLWFLFIFSAKGIEFLWWIQPSSRASLLVITWFICRAKSTTSATETSQLEGSKAWDFAWHWL